MFPLEAAVCNGDLDRVFKLLNGGALIIGYGQPLMNQALEKNQKEIALLLAQYGAYVDFFAVMRIFKLGDGRFAREMVCMLLQRTRNRSFLCKIFTELAFSEYQGPDALHTLKVLISAGLPVDDFVDGHRTPMHLSVINDRMDFVQFLLDFGADINKKTSIGASNLCLATQNGYEGMVKLLLTKGVRINERAHLGRTALHYACDFAKTEMVSLLINWGADINIANDRNRVPVSFTCPLEIKEIFIKELARLKFEGEPLCYGNLVFLLQERNLLSNLQECADELQAMKDHVIYGDLSLCDILRVKENRKRLIFLARNEIFVEKFLSDWNRDSFKYYAATLDRIFVDNLERRDYLEREKEKFHKIFKNYLPDLVIRKVTLFANEHLFNM